MKLIYSFKTLSEEDIINEREKLLQSIDPTLVQFLANRRFGSHTQQMEVATITGQDPKDAPAHSVEQATNESSVVDSLKKKYIDLPNMNKDEPEKREWMSDLPEVSFLQAGV